MSNHATNPTCLTCGYADDNRHAFVGPLCGVCDHEANCTDADCGWCAA